MLLTLSPRSVNFSVAGTFAPEAVGFAFLFLLPILRFLPRLRSGILILPTDVVAKYRCHAQIGLNDTSVESAVNSFVVYGFAQ